MSGKHSKHYSDEDHEYVYEDYEEYTQPEPVHLPSHEHRRKCTKVKCEAQGQDQFCVPLSFDQELVLSGAGNLIALSTVASNNDNIRGVLKLKFNSSLSKAAYALYVYNALSEDNRIIGAHLHAGSASQNGQVVVSLFEGPPRNVNGLLIKGVFDNRSVDDLNATGFPAINSVASLYQAIRDGNLYVNVHSELFPEGIIRGQIYLRNLQH